LFSTSFDDFDVRPVTWCFGERRVAGHDRRIERLGQGYVHGVVRRDVIPQLPRASQEIEMGVTVKIEVGEIRDRVRRSVGRHLACAYEASEALSYFNVRKVRRMELVLVSKKTRLDSDAKWSL
jgi:hypothetical protein